MNSGEKMKAPAAATVGTQSGNTEKLSVSILLLGQQEDKPLTHGQVMEWLGIDMRKQACVFVDKGVA